AGDARRRRVRRRGDRAGAAELFPAWTELRRDHRSRSTRDRAVARRAAEEIVPEDPGGAADVERSLELQQRAHCPEQGHRRPGPEDEYPLDKVGAELSDPSLPVRVGLREALLQFLVALRAALLHLRAALREALL